MVEVCGAFGKNWWEYYFEPIILGSSENAEIEHIDFYFWQDIEFLNSRLENNYLIQKYIRIKPEITNKLNAFINQEFKDHYIIGVHYRGTDKVRKEAPRINYDQVALEINKHIALTNVTNWKIFIATDEGEFLEYMSQVYPNRVCFYEKHYIGNQPIHKTSPNPYISGEEALLDCLLLSKANFLFRTSSNLSMVSTFFNPDLPVVELSKRAKYKFTKECPKRSFVTLYLD